MYYSHLSILRIAVIKTQIRLAVSFNIKSLFKWGRDGPVQSV